MDEKNALTALNEQIEATNATFLAGTRTEKRRMLATDMLEQLAMKRIVSSPGVYFRFNEWGDESGNEKIYRDHGKEDLRDKLKTIQTCRVCAIGAVFVCAVQRLNEMEIDATIGWAGSGQCEASRSPLVNYLVKHDLFSFEEMGAAEVFFENYDYRGKYRRLWTLTHSGARLARIAKFILENPEREITVELLGGDPPSMEALPPSIREDYGLLIEECVTMVDVVSKDHRM